MAARERTRQSSVTTATSAEPAPRSAQTLGTVAVGLVASVAATTLIAVVARALGASTAFSPLTPMAYVPLAVIGFLLGLAGWWVIRARTRRPAQVLRVVVPVVLALSFIPDVLVAVSGVMPGTSLGAVLALMLMHLAIAAIAIPTFQRALPVRD